MKKLFTVIATMSLLIIPGCGDGGDNGVPGGSTAVCPSESTLAVVKGDNVDAKNFDYQASYGNYNKTFGTYRAIFINYDRSEDSDFKTMEGDETKVVIAVFNKDGGELTPGTYKLQDSNSMSVTIETAEGYQGTGSLDGADVGSVEITYVGDDKICGNVDVEDSYGLILKGEFNVPNEEA